MKKSLAASVGFLVGLLLFAVGREIAFDERSWTQMLSDALRAVGGLGWVDTTLVTGLAAVAAAYVSVRAVRDQIEQERSLEDERRLAKLQAARSVLSLSLSNLCDYSTTCAQLNHDLLLQCGKDRLPRDIVLPAYPVVPDTPVAVLKEMVELSDHTAGMVFAKLASKLQVQSARLRGTARDKAGGQSPSKSTLESHLIDALEVYARCSCLFDYARFEAELVPEELPRGALSAAIHNVGIYSRLYPEIAERCNLYEELAQQGMNI
ncbi:hypothetical protein ACQEDT_23985 [Agrobacterium pusense]|uniref:hypothetical protein n=1 Tax=Agrobacterium pusense TaxID=648995 RepID=UPI003D10011F